MRRTTAQGRAIDPNELPRIPIGYITDDFRIKADDGVLPCNGSSYWKSDYPQLYAVLCQLERRNIFQRFYDWLTFTKPKPKCVYGETETTFRVPDLVCRMISSDLPAAARNVVTWIDEPAPHPPLPEPNAHNPSIDNLPRHSQTISCPSCVTSPARQHTYKPGCKLWRPLPEPSKKRHIEERG